jgi:ketosteroid isomerase-like protein
LATVADGGGVVADRSAIEQLLRELYGARRRGDLDAVCRVFAEDAKFKIAGVSQYASPIAIRAVGIAEIRQWLALLLKTFQLSDLNILAILIEGDSAAVQWRAQVHSRITGLSVATDLVDLVDTRDRRIVSYTEFLAPR